MLSYRFRFSVFFFFFVTFFLLFFWLEGRSGADGSGYRRRGHVSTRSRRIVGDFFFGRPRQFMFTPGLTAPFGDSFSRYYRLVGTYHSLLDAQ